MLNVGWAQHASAVALVMLDLVARTWRIQALLPIRFRPAFAATAASDTLAAVTPARAGGEPVRFARFVNAGMTPASTLAAMAVETLVGGAILLLGGLAFAMSSIGRSLVASQAAAASRLPWWWTVTSVVVLVAVFGLLVRGHWRAIRDNWVSTVRESLRQTISQPIGRVLMVTWWTLVSFVARAAILPLLIAGAAGVTPPILWMTTVGAVYGLLVAPTPGGVGVVELGFFATLRRILGVADVTILLVIWRVYAYGLSAAIGGIVLIDTWFAKRRDSGAEPEG